MNASIITASRVWLVLNWGGAVTACATGSTLDDLVGEDRGNAAGKGSASGDGVGTGGMGGAGGTPGVGTAGGNAGAAESNAGAGGGQATSDGGEGGAPSTAGAPGVSGADNEGGAAGSGAGGSDTGGSGGAVGGTEQGGSPNNGGSPAAGGIPASGGQPPLTVDACARANWSANAVPYCQTGLPDCTFAETARLPQYGIDGDLVTRFASGQPKAGGEYFSIVFPETVSLSGLHVISTDTLDAAEAYELRYSTDGTTFVPFNPAVAGLGAPTLNIAFPVTQMRALRFIQTAADTSADPKWWTVHEFQPQNCVDQGP